MEREPEKKEIKKIVNPNADYRPDGTSQTLAQFLGPNYFFAPEPVEKPSKTDERKPIILVNPTPTPKSTE